MVSGYNSAERLIRSEPFNNDSVWKSEQLALLAQYRKDAESKAHLPRMKMEDNGKDTAVKLEKDKLLSARATFNGVPLNTVFDMAISCPLLITKKFADQCDIKRLPSARETDSIPVNGIMARCEYALVDSIQIGSVCIRNVPTLVIYDNPKDLLPDSIRSKMSKKKRKEHDSAFERYKAFIGFPALRKLGSLEIDWKRKEMRASAKGEEKSGQGAPNMFSAGNNLFIELSINGAAYTGLVNSSLASVALFPSFYEQHKSKIALSPKEKSSETNPILTVSEEKYREIINPTLLFDGKELKPARPSDCIVWTNKSDTPPTYNGQIGLNFFKQLGDKVKFDFVNMRLTAE